MMSLKKKLLLTCLSLTIVTGVGASNQKSESISEPNFEELAIQYPAHFKGFNGNLKITEAVQAKRARGEFTISGENPLAKEAMKDLSSKLHAHKGPEDFTQILTAVDETIARNEPVGFMDYLFQIGRIAFSQGVGVKDEQDFFTMAGFSMPYKMINQMQGLGPVDTIRRFVSLIEKSKDIENEPGDFFHSTPYHNFEMGDHIETRIKKGSFALMPCFLPGEDILGYFYLAWTYAKGIHPIPVPFDDNKDELHGIAMSRWAKVCHDMAHSKADASDISVENFAHGLVTKHTSLLNAHQKTMTLEEKKKYQVRAIADSYVDFALTIHSLYRQSLLDILGRSLVQFDLTGQEFNNFSVSSFVAMHEEPQDMSSAYTLGNLEDLLKENFVPYKVQMGIANMGIDDMFKTSYATGDSPLSDEEIFNLVKGKNQSEFKGRHLNHTGDSPIDPDRIADYEVVRNKFSIAVTITTLDGTEYFLSRATNYSSQLNFKHDLSILEPLAPTLKADYGFDLPTIPTLQDVNGDISEYEMAANSCYAALENGRYHTMDIFFKSALKLSQEKSEDAPSIADKFATGYQTAVDTLAEKVGPFVGDVKAFLKEMRDVSIAAIQANLEAMHAELDKAVETQNLLTAEKAEIEVLEHKLQTEQAERAETLKAMDAEMKERQRQIDELQAQLDQNKQ